MFGKLADGGKALVFYAIALVLALAVALIPGATTFVYAFTPLVAVAITMFIVTREGYTKEGLKSLGLHRPGMRAWPAAVLVPLLVMGVSYGVVWTTGLAPFSVPERPFGVEMPLWLVPVLTLWLIVQASLTTALGGRSAGGATSSRASSPSGLGDRRSSRGCCTGSGTCPSSC